MTPLIIFLNQISSIQKWLSIVIHRFVKIKFQNNQRKPKAFTWVYNEPNFQKKKINISVRFKPIKNLNGWHTFLASPPSKKVTRCCTFFASQTSSAPSTSILHWNEMISRSCREKTGGPLSTMMRKRYYCELPHSLLLRASL